MFKTDKKSLEELSFGFDECDIANFRNILEYISQKGLLTVSEKEVKRVMTGLEKIAKLKLNGKVYGFHIYDSYADAQDGGEGVELYLRQGNSLNVFFGRFDRDGVYDVNDAIDYLKKHKISTIYTGAIPKDSGFLGLSYEVDEEDPIIKTPLEDHEISRLEGAGVKVIKLDYLV